LPANTDAVPVNKRSSDTPKKAVVPLTRIGCAGWSIPAAHRDSFPAFGSHLEKYASVFEAVEINSSFYRPHRPATYGRWATSVPANFRFSVKMPRTISHERRLVDCNAEVVRFLAEVEHLGSSLGCLLLQLPPSLVFEMKHVVAFLRLLRDRYAGAVACEPRHRSWFTPEVDRLLAEHAVARVGADPPIVSLAALPGGDRSIDYLRLHGSPRIYYDAYSTESLEVLHEQLDRSSSVTRERWCIFDNTALGHATANALALLASR
jgi:uncharacterized protein YecE (DUF72 family)